jgi:bacteriorhodopsin
MTAADSSDPYHGFLSPNDPVAISFWIISISMVASTVFFLMDSMVVGDHWKTSINVGSLVTLVAAVHYFYMREYWIIMHTSPILYRYIDWSITVPLQMVEFNLILVAAKPDAVDPRMFWRLLLGTVAMLTFGYGGETHSLGPFGAWLGFVLGCSGWGYILYEIFLGPAGKLVADSKAGADGKQGAMSENVAGSFNTMRFIVTIGWSIYPLGYFFGYLLGSVEACILNLIYNLADFVNKIAFCLAIWACAKSSTLADQKKQEPK